MIHGQRRDITVHAVRDAQILGPDLIAVKIKSDQVAVGEDGVGTSAIGGHGGGGDAGVFGDFRGFETGRVSDFYFFLPEQGAGISIKAEDVLSLVGAAGEENAIFPNDR